MRRYRGRRNRRPNNRNQVNPDVKLALSILFRFLIPLWIIGAGLDSMLALRGIYVIKDPIIFSIGIIWLVVANIPRFKRNALRWFIPILMIGYGILMSIYATIYQIPGYSEYMTGTITIIIIGIIVLYFYNYKFKRWLRRKLIRHLE